MAKKVTERPVPMAKVPPKAPETLDVQAADIRRAALEFAINCGADKSNVIPLASTIEGYIRNGMPKS